MRRFLLIIECFDDGWMIDEYMSWIIMVFIIIVVFVLCVWNVGFFNSFVFDEIYYFKDVWMMFY